MYYLGEGVSQAVLSKHPQHTWYTSRENRASASIFRDEATSNYETKISASKYQTFILAEHALSLDATTKNYIERMTSDFFSI